LPKAPTYVLSSDTGALLDLLEDIPPSAKVGQQVAEIENLKGEIHKLTHKEDRNQGAGQGVTFCPSPNADADT
jgi:hypothetical protein